MAAATPQDYEGRDSDSIPGVTAPTGGKSTLIGKLGNYSVQYNLGAASIAAMYLISQDDHALGSDSLSRGDFPEPEWAKYNLLGAVFAGAVIGMLTMGYLGDLLGRKRAMLITLSFVVFGALGCAFFPMGGVDSIYGTIIGFRFVVGVGVGGIYPLSAVSSAEAKSDALDSASELRRQAAGRVGWAFFWQVPGAMSPYILSLILVGIHALHDSFDPEYQFRIVFGMGAIPAAAVMYLQWKEQESQAFVEAKQERDDEETFNPWEWAMAQKSWPELRNALIGTAGTWFLYDVAFYGTAIFTPTILKSIFGDNDTLAGISWQGVMTTFFGVPGCITGIIYLKKKGCFFLNFYGFLLMAFAFGSLALVYTIDSDLHVPLFILFLFLNFSINNGPSVATFVLPALCFPTEVRSTFHGVSAAAAKLGAVAGTFMYTPLSKATSFAFIMWMQSGLCLLGALVAYFFIPRTDRVIGGTYEQINDDPTENAMTP